MAKREILTFPHPHLRLKAEPLQQVDASINQLIDDMFETMYASQGVGLAATQIDIQQQIVVIDLADEEHKPLVLINAEILEKSGEQISEEGCLSVPEIFAKVKRAQTVKIKALDRKGKPFELEAEGHLAVCIQHELDHLNGKLFVDYLSPIKQHLVRKKMEKRQRVRG